MNRKRIPRFGYHYPHCKYLSYFSRNLLTQTCSKDGLINETSGPYFTGMVVDSADTIYLTREEIDLITHYRNADADERKLTQKYWDFNLIIINTKSAAKQTDTRL